VPTGRSADPRSTITGIGSGREAGQDIVGYDSQHQAIVGADGRKIDIKPMIAALQKVSPGAAKNPFVASDDGSTLRFSPDVQRTLVQRFDELNKVGGVALDVTFQNLALSWRARYAYDRPDQADREPGDGLIEAIGGGGKALCRLP
jgi:hypothetical protein